MYSNYKVYGNICVFIFEYIYKLYGDFYKCSYKVYGNLYVIVFVCS